MTYVLCPMSLPLMKRTYTWNWITQCILVLVAAFALKLHYSTASADQLRWILAPTAALVELVSGATFEFESHAGYISRERGFLIANSSRITIALLLRPSSMEIDWLNPDQLHRFEGVFIYFGFLLLLFVVSEKMDSEKTLDSFRRSLFPTLVHYALALCVPLVIGADRL